LKKQKENRWVAPSILGMMCVGAFLLRVLPQWDKVFADGAVLYRGVDSWYHMRLADNMMYNFPHLLKWDMFALYPNGAEVGYYPLLTWLIVGISKLGFNYEIVGAFLPPILGALILVPVYFLGKELFGKGVGLVACLLVAILPGELLHRSLLGFTDQHILESFLMVTTILFLILAYKHKRYLYYGFAGLFLGLYLLNWGGGPFLVFIIFAWFIVQFCYDRLRLKPIANLCYGASTVFAVSLLLSFLILPRFHLIVLTFAILAPICLQFLTKLNRRTFLWVLIGGGLVILGVLCSNLWDIGWSLYIYFRAVFWGWGGTIQEVAPTTIPVAFAVYGISIFLMLGGLYYAIKNKVSLLFIVWSIILLLAIIGQRRWGYYATIPVALLASYFVFRISRWVKKDVRTAAIIVLCFLMILPSIGGIIGVATLPNNINLDWYSACVWIRGNTPDPFPLIASDYRGWTEGAYYELEVPEADYGVVSWWDYGHWIIRIAHRVPSTSPTWQDTPVGSKFFASKTIEEAERELAGLNIKYAVLDEAILTGKWYAVIGKAKKDTDVLESIAYRLWNDKLEGWELIHEEGSVRVFERTMKR